MTTHTGSSALLRHTLATLAYRGGKAIRDAPPDFSGFRPGPTTRSAGEVLAHLSDLLDWALSIAQGHQTWKDSQPAAWAEDVARFHAALAALDSFLATTALEPGIEQGLFQGPIADALTHVGQIALMRRLAGVAIKSENYHRADIQAGRLGAAQTPPKREF
jgi:hypothetical protein